MVDFSPKAMLERFFGLLQLLLVLEGIQVGQDPHHLREPMNLAGTLPVLRSWCDVHAVQGDKRQEASAHYLLWFECVSGPILKLLERCLESYSLLWFAGQMTHAAQGFHAKASLSTEWTAQHCW